MMMQACFGQTDPVPNEMLVLFCGNNKPATTIYNYYVDKVIQYILLLKENKILHKQN